MPYDPETGEFYDDSANGGTGYQPTNADWAAKRLADKRALEEKTRADNAERELAFYKAGVDPTKDPRIADFVKAYDGKLTPEDIAAAAQARGYLAAEQTPPAPDPAAAPGAPAAGEPSPDPAVQAALDAQQRAAAAATGAAPPPVDPSTIIEQAFQQGGERALMDSLAAQGVPLAYDGRIRG